MVLLLANRTLMAGLALPWYSFMLCSTCVIQFTCLSVFSEPILLLYAVLAGHCSGKQDIRSRVNWTPRVFLRIGRSTVQSDRLQLFLKYFLANKPTERPTRATK